VGHTVIVCIGIGGIGAVVCFGLIGRAVVVGVGGGRGGRLGAAGQVVLVAVAVLDDELGLADIAGERDGVGADGRRVELHAGVVGRRVVEQLRVRRLRAARAGRAHHVRRSVA